MVFAYADSVTTIGLLAFAHCTDLTSITFTSDTPPRINGGAFDGCDSLTEIRVPAGAEVAYREELSKAGLVLDGGGIELKVEYSITVTATEGGTAYASPDFAAAGEEIILTAKPDSGYRLKEWQVESGGVTVDVDSNRFVMPAEAVTVNAVFEKEAAPQPPSHTHAWTGAWSWDSTHHWHECLAEGCTIVSDSDKDGYFGVSPAYVLGKSQTMYDKNILNFDASSVPEEYTAKNYDECDLLQIFRLLPENGKTYLLTTLRMLEKFYS